MKAAKRRFSPCRSGLGPKGGAWKQAVRLGIVYEEDACSSNKPTYTEWPRCRLLSSPGADRETPVAAEEPGACSRYPDNRFPSRTAACPASLRHPDRKHLQDRGRCNPHALLRSGSQRPVVPGGYVGERVSNLRGRGLCLDGRQSARAGEDRRLERDRG